MTFWTEAELFPHGPHDDQVDAVSGAFEMLTSKVVNTTGIDLLRGARIYG